MTLPLRGTLDLTPITVVGCLPNAHFPADLRYPDIVSVLKMSDLYGVSLDYLLKGDSPMKNYLDYIEESTNVVKSKVKLSKLILILSYLVIWAFNIMVSWFFFCGKYFRSTGRRIPMARASGSNDCNISSFFYNSIIRFTVFPSHKLCFLRSFPVTM